ncbi:MAG: hypothetical protein A3F72_13640 [Bacteroidetes bacterium RIFCSPLOWO2_12_FULL_35_15]|nr:MAG: hypothetical protein A3F72_13640 [Bacteroidetes bacterium RIFCSPLOWO2_12_FULL_35_15]
MKKTYLSKTLIFIFLLTSILGYSTTYYSIASAGWTTPSTWSTVACGGAASLTSPGTGDDVVICVGTTVTMNGNAGACNSLTINGTANWAAAYTTNAGVGGITINPGGDITGAFAGILTTQGGIVLNTTLTSTLVKLKTITTPGQIISGTGSLARLDISATSTNNGNLTVTTLLSTSTGSSLSQGVGATLNYKGTAISLTLDASAASNTVNYSGAAQTVKSATYQNLTISGSSTKTLGGAITVNGNLTINAGTLYTSTYQITGNATGIFSMAAGTFLTIGNSTSATDIAFPTNFINANISLASTSTVSYDGNNAQTISSIPTYGSVKIQTYAGSKIADGNLNIAGNLYVYSPSTIDMSLNTLSITGNYLGSGGLSFSSGTFNLGGNFTNTGSFTAGTGTVNFNGGGAQTIRGVNYYNLTFSGAGAKTLAAASTIGISGDFIRGAMTVTPGASNTVLFNGVAQNMTGNATSFTNITINNASLTISSNITINSTLTFTTGNIITGANSVIISAAGIVSRTSGHVEGNLSKNVAIGSNVSRTFEIGTGSDYTPLDNIFASVTSAGNLTASTTSGDHPQIASSGFTASSTVNRYWTITNTSIVYTNYSATCNFVNSDKDVGLNTGSCIIKLYNGAVWSSPNVGTQGANATQATSVTIPVTPNTIELQIGENTVSPTGSLYSIATGNWSTSGTWSYTSGGVSCACFPTSSDSVTIENNFTVTMDGNSGSAKSLTINTGGVATWASALTTNIGSGGIKIEATGDITGTANGIINTAGGLTLDKVLTSTSITIKTVTTAGQIISGTGTLAKLDISANTTNNGTLTVTSTLSSSIASTLTQGIGATLNFSGSPISPTLDATAAGNTVNYNGAVQIVKPTTYQNLTCNSSNKTIGGAITVNGNLTVSAGNLFTSTYQITGNATGSLTLAAGASLYVGANSSATNVAFPTLFTNANISLASNSTVIYYGNNAQTVSSVPDYGNLSVQTFSGSKSADGDINVSGNLTLTTPASIDMSIYTLNLTGNCTGAGGLTFSSGIFNIAGAYSNTGTFTYGTGTVDYNGGSAQTVRGVNYNNLTFSGAGTKTLQAAATVGIAGDFTRGTMTVTPGATNTVLFNGVAQIMTGDATTFTNVTINNTSLTINGDITINSTLTFTAGNIITAANNVIIPAVGTVSRTSGHVVGNLRKNVATGSNVSRTFELGSGTDYTPLDLTFATVSSAGNLTASTTIGDHAAIATSGFLASATVNRYWTITNSAIVYTNYNVTANFVNTDKDAGLLTSACAIRIYNGAAWSLPTVGTQGANATQATSVTIPATPSTIDLQIGEKACSTTGSLYSIATGNWTTPTLWSETTGGPSVGCTPTNLDDVIIENSFTVTMDANPGAAKSLSVNTGGVATWASAFTTNIGSGGINIAATGDITGAGAGVLGNSGDLTLNTNLTSTTFTLQMNGVGKTISGTGTIANLEINANTTNSGSITLTDVLTVNAGDLGNSGTFTLKSDITKTACLAPVTGTLSGNFKVERYISARAPTSAEITSPVSGAFMSDWDATLYFDYNTNPPGQYGTIMQYDETIADYAAVNSGTALTSGQGFLVYFADDSTLSAFTPCTTTVTGPLTYGDQTINLSYTNNSSGPYGAGDPSLYYDGENIAGNPFASPVTVGSMTLTNCLQYIDVYDHISQAWVPLSGADVIGSGQGFWAYAQGAGASVTVPESAKVADLTTGIRSVANTNPFLNLTISGTDQNNTMSHTLKVACAADANDGWDPKDHPFRKSRNKLAPSITTNAEATFPLTICTFTNSHDEYTLPVNVHVGMAGKFQINATGVSTINTDYSCVSLEDKVAQQFIDLNSTTNYAFFATPSDARDRFALHFSKSGNCKSMISSTNSALDNQVQVLQNQLGNTINFNYNEIVNTTITVTSILGQTIISDINVNASTQSINISLPEGFHGLYFVKIQSEKGEIVKKFVKP